MIRIAVLMTVFNRRETTIKCLQNLQIQTYDKGSILIDVYLTNDGCTDGTPEAVRREFPTVKIIEGDGNLFWNRGMIAAWREAALYDYDFYLWLNDDTFLYENTIIRLLETSNKFENKAIVVGATCAVGNRNRITYGGWKNGELVRETAKSVKCSTMNGNIVLIPRSVFLAIGYTDSYYRHALGDIDYGINATKNGIDIYTSGGVLGECDLHEHPTIWMNPSYSFKKRWKNFMSPNGNNPFEFFYFRCKNFGTVEACFSFVSNWIHFLFPWFWNYKNSIK